MQILLIVFLLERIKENTFSRLQTGNVVFLLSSDTFHLVFQCLRIYVLISDRTQQLVMQHGTHCFATGI